METSKSPAEIALANWSKNLRSVIQQNERDARTIVGKHSFLASLLEDDLKAVLGDYGYQVHYVERGSGVMPTIAESAEDKVLWEVAAKVPAESLPGLEYRYLAAFRVANNQLSGNATVWGVVQASRAKESIVVTLNKPSGSFEFTKETFRDVAEKLLVAITRHIWFDGVQDSEFHDIKALAEKRSKS